MNPFVTLEGKRILVTGASSGIGRACAVMAAELGASVTLVARRAEALEETRQLMVAPERHRCLAWDFASGQDVAPLFADILKDGKLNGLVHAAGIGPAMPLAAIDMQEAKRVMEVNWLSFLALMKQCAKKRVAEPGFSVVVISSTSALSGSPGQSVYGASKGAVSSMVRTFAIELAPKGIRVNAVCPSNIKTPMFDAVVGEITDEAGQAALIAKQPLGLGEPEQVAAPVCFLLSEAASFITGVNLPVDGGYLAQ